MCSIQIERRKRVRKDCRSNDYSHARKSSVAVQSRAVRRYFIALLKCVPIVILLSNSGDSTAGRCKVVGIIV
jgi:hypothetical protein